MVHIIKHQDSDTYVKNVISDGNNVRIKFTNNKQLARRFKLYRAASNVISVYLSSYYKVETIKESF